MVSGFVTICCSNALNFCKAKIQARPEEIEPPCLLVRWLLTCLALTIERLYRLRYLHRGNHRPRTAIELVRLLRFPAIFP